MSQQPIEQKPVHQRVVFKDQAHGKMLKGAKILADAVVSTMGPSGHNVIIDFGNGGAPLITKDGVTVAKSICLSDKLESIGAELIKEVASKTNEIAGDGTTTATALAYNMLAKGIQLITTGRSAIHIKQGMDKAVEFVIQFLIDNSLQISHEQEIINVATISANGDEELGRLICQAIQKVGRDGIVTIEPAKSINTTLDVVDGMRLESGYASPFFITNSDKANCEFTNPMVLITSNKISSIADIVPSMEIAIKANRPLVIVADEIEGEALHTLIVNKTKGVIKVCAVKSPFHGEHKAEVLSDLATVVGAEVIGATSGVSLAKVTSSQLGGCAKFIATKQYATFVGESNNIERTEQINKKIEELRSALSDPTVTLDSQQALKYKSRLARLSGGIAVIRVGGATETEIKEKKDRIEDAVNATMAAVQEGIVAGGGTALFYAAQELKNIIKNKSKFVDFGEVLDNHIDDYIDGMNVIIAACESPLRSIAKNTGISDDVVVSMMPKYESKLTNKMVDENNRIIEYKLPNEITTAFKSDLIVRDGYNARDGVYCDMISSGIIDPVKVTRYALLHASSVVGLMLTCNAVIVDEDEI